MALVVVQLSVLLCAIIFCLRRKKRSLPAESGESSQRSTATTNEKKKGGEDDKPEEKNGQENGFPIIANHRPTKQNNSKRINHSFRNFNFMDTEDCADVKDSSMSSASYFRPDNFQNFDENRNRGTLVNVYQSGKMLQEQRSHQACSLYGTKIHPLQNASDVQYEAMRHYFRKSNDLNNGRAGDELGT